jgi:hypothetical protein
VQAIAELGKPPKSCVTFAADEAETMWLRPSKARAWLASALIPRCAVLSTAANPTDGRFDGEAMCFAEEAVHPEVISRLLGR